MTDTNSTWAARDHARSQAGANIETMPTIPASAWTDPPEGVSSSQLTWAEVMAGDGATSKVLSRGTSLRLRDRGGDACVHLLLYNADQPWERLNIADTVKIPWQAYLRVGHPLLSDQGRVLATIVADESGRHDALCGGGAVARARFVNLGAKHGLEPYRPACRSSKGSESRPTDHWPSSAGAVPAARSLCAASYR